MKIAFYDSGIGGLTIFEEAKEKIEADFIYLADNLHTPYGTRDKKEVKQYVCNCVEELVKEGAQIIVIACNTATSVGIGEVRKKYPHICMIGTEPAVKVAYDERLAKKKIVVAATSLTIQEEKLKKLVHQLGIEKEVSYVALDQLVKFAENMDFSSSQVRKYLQEKFDSFELEDVSHFVLGCTHFPFFTKVIQEVLPKNIKIVNSAEGIVNRIIHCMEEGKEEEIIEHKTKLIITQKDAKFVEKWKKITHLEGFEVKIMEHKSIAE